MEKVSSVSRITKNATITFVEKYKGMRRIVLVIVLYINLHIFAVTVDMYYKTGVLDIQWIIYAGYWTAILGTFIAFYTTSRVREFNSYTPDTKPGEWIYEEGKTDEIVEIDGDKMIQTKSLTKPSVKGKK
ncbi:MAG: hypothetical protein PHT94_01075 [Candidatus Nanoarchaeia archaeon]|nr:hypothetical protein [Candidatus Nanoarchaeia archaeon]